MKKFCRHYDWLRDHFVTFLNNLNVAKAEGEIGLITAHGDKCYGYQDDWEDAGIPFPHGVAIYLITHIRPWGLEVRTIRNSDGTETWVDVRKWVIDNYNRFKEHLPDVPDDYYHDMP